MSKHTDTGRAGKKLWILIPVIAVLIIAAALVWLNSVYVYAGGLHRRDSAQIDLRGKSISEERYLRLREQLPDCKIYWDVPIGGAVIDCESTAIVLTSLTEKDVARLAFFPALAELDLTAADVSPERFDAVRAAYPALSVRWSIPIGASRYPSDAESITLTDFTVSELPLFDYFTALRSADARGCVCYDALLALREKYPALELEWQVPLGSTEYLDSATEIAVDDISITPDALREAIRETAVKAFRVLGCSGVSRIDFMIDCDENKVYLNEINTIPGSLSFYLWEPLGVSYTELLERMISLGMKRHRERAALTYSFDSNVLSGIHLGGAKGTKV